MYNQGILEFSNQSHSIPKTAGPPKNFDLFNKFQRKDAFLETNKQKTPQESKHKSGIYSLKPCLMGDAKKKKQSV